MNKVQPLPKFTDSLQDKCSTEKKVMIVTVDGGPSKNPRHAYKLSTAQFVFLMSTILMRVL